jgi:hypothetical protein
MLYDSLHDQAPLLRAECGELAGGTASHNPIDSPINGTVDKETKPCLVNPTVRRERGGEGGEYAVEL